MKNYDCLISIDPDCDKSGTACLNTEKRDISIEALTFPKLLDYLTFESDRIRQSGKSLLVIVEAGWLNESNWHLKKGDSKRVASAKGNAVGRNHEVGRIIVQMCKHYGIEVIEQRPLKKCWKGKDGKITHDEIAQFITGFPKKSNQETRDAALLGWHHAGFPIRVKV